MSEAFVLEELLPRFSHCIDMLYPKSDVHQVSEGNMCHNPDFLGVSKI